MTDAGIAPYRKYRHHRPGGYHLEPGFNALTGETGAGKSIVIDSLSAVLGQRTSRDLIRTGADKAYVSACFTGIPPEVGEDLGITWDEELLLQREIHADGKNVCRVGSRPSR